MLVKFVAFCMCLSASLALGQSVTQENLGIVTAPQLSSGLGWEVDALNEEEFVAAAAAGAKHVRLDGCSWSSVEGQSNPPNNVSTGYSLPPGCVQALTLAKKYGLQPTVIAGYGAPYHQILTLELASAAAYGSKTLSVSFTSGVGGKTLQSLEYPYDYITDAKGDQFTSHYNDNDGTLIINSTMTGSNTATLTLSSALSMSLPAGTVLEVNEILYPSPATGNVSDPSNVAFGHYAEYLASQLYAYGLTGEVELWNEPPWAHDCWDNRVNCFDTDPKIPGELQGNGPNYGFPAVIQTSTPVPGVTYVWAGTNKSGSADLMGGRMLQYSGAGYRDPQSNVTTESFHPYGSNPEDGMWNQPCLQADPALGQTCNTIPANQGNIVNAEANDLVAQAKNPSFGIKHNITETGASTLYIPTDHMARFMMRQYLGYMADGMTSIEFYRLYDTSTPGQTGFSSITLTDNNSAYTPLPAYTALSGLMSDLAPISGAPVASYSSSTLPTVTSYAGTYNLDHLSVVGSRAGDAANSVMYIVWQRSYSTTSCQNNDPEPCWGTLAAPPGAPTVITIPSGMKVLQVVNLDTREAVNYTQSGSTIELAVSDDPIEVMYVPANDTTSSLTPHLAFNILPSLPQGSVISAAAVSNSPGAITYSIVSGPATINGNVISLPTAGTIVIQANQAATSTYIAASMTASVSVVAQATKLVFTPIQPHTFGDVLGVSAQSTSPAPITYYVVSGPASISGSTVTMTSAGTVVLGASQPASGVYAPATTTISFPVSGKAPTLSMVPVASQTYGNAVTASVNSPSSGAVTYSVVSGPATISGSAVTLTNVGEVVLKASQAASGGYLAATATTQFYVSAKTPTLTFTSIPAMGFNQPIIVNASSQSNGPIIYSIVSGPARINGSTVTTLSTAGTVVVSAYQGVSGGYAAATATTNFTVAASSSSPVVPKLTFASIASHAAGDVFPVSASSASTGVITYSVASGPATMSGNSVTTTGAGTIVVRASQAATTNYAAATATTSFTVAAATPQLVFASVPSVGLGQSVTVSASSASTGVITYSVASGPATMSGNSLTVTGAGTVVVRASQAATTNYAAASATTSFTVAAATPQLVFASVPSVGLGQSVTVSASSASTGVITYSVASGPATMSGNSLTVTGAGTVVVRASQAATTNYAAASATTSFTVNQAVPKLLFVDTASVGLGQSVTVSASSASTGVITYSVASGPATMSGNSVTTTGAGTVVVRASQAATTNYAAASATTSFTVNQAVPKLLFVDTASVGLGQSVTVSASSASTGAITYSVASGPATISGNSVRTTGAGTVMVRASQAATTNYAAATATTSFTVAAATPQLVFASVPSVGLGQSVTVSASSASTGVITYSVASGPATMSGNSVTTTGAGTIVVRASQAATTNYAAASATTSFTVAAATPQLVFASVPSVGLGQSVTVSASSASTGAITYSVASGPATISGNSVRTTGAGTVMVRASQAATTNYAAATATTSFTVAGRNAQLKFVNITPKTFGDNLNVLAQSYSQGAITYSVESGPAIISGRNVTMNGSGTVVLKAVQVASGLYDAATTTISFQVAPDPYPLTYVHITPKTVGDVLGVRATTASPALISYFVVSGPAIIVGSTVTTTAGMVVPVTMTGVGTVVLGAHQNAIGVWPSADTTISFSVNAKP